MSATAALRAVLARFITKHATRQGKKKAAPGGGLKDYAAGVAVGSSNGASAAARFSSRTACQISSR